MSTFYSIRITITYFLVSIPKLIVFTSSSSCNCNRLLFSVIAASVRQAQASQVLLTQQQDLGGGEGVSTEVRRRSFCRNDGVDSDDIDDASDDGAG